MKITAFISCCTLLPACVAAATNADDLLAACEASVLANRTGEALIKCQQAYDLTADSTQSDIHQAAGFRLIDVAIANHDYPLAGRLIDQMSMSLSSQETATEYRLLRKRGAILFHQENHAAAIESFQRALTLAEASDDVLGMGKSHNDLGAAYRARGQYQESLQHLLKGLHFKKRIGDKHAIATTINNIGNVYRDMGDHENALAQYDQAIVIFNQSLAGSADQRARSNIAHTEENIGLSLAALGRVDEAVSSLQSSLRSFEMFDRPLDQVRLNLSIASVLIDHGSADAAGLSLDAARTVADEHGIETRLKYFELMSRQFTLKDDHASALLYASDGYEFATERDNAAMRARFARLLSEAHAGLGQYRLAYDRLSQHRDLITAVSESRYNEDLARIRTQYDLQSREEQIRLLNKDILISSLEQRQTILLFSIGLILLAALLATLWIVRARQQSRLRARIASHQQRERELRSSIDRLRTILDVSDDPMVLVDQSNHILYANKPFNQLIGLADGVPPGAPVDHYLTNLLQQPVFLDLNEEMSEIRLSNLTVVSASSDAELPQSVSADCLIQSDGSVLISLMRDQPDTGNLSAVSALATLKQLNQLHEQFTTLRTRLTQPDASITNRNGKLWSQLTDVSDRLGQVLAESNIEDVDVQYRTSLVSLMTTTMAVWRESTGMDKLELAEQSGIWRISIDEGRLRTRSLDRYLALQHLPKNPRWREVLRTVHYVLANCELPAAVESDLTDRLKHFELLQQARL